MSSTVNGSQQLPPQPGGAMPPRPAGPPAPIQSQPPAHPGRAVSVIGIVSGGFALLLSWIPVINNLAFVLGLAGLVLGVIGLVLAIRRHGPKALSVVALALSAVSLVIVLVTQAAYGAVLDSVSESLGEPTAAPVVSSPDTGQAAGAEAGADDEAVEQAAEEAEAASGVALGEASTVGRYSVVVESVDLDATDAVTAANTFNGAPENGVYATTDLTVTFQGEDEGMPLFDLDIELLGGDQRNYATYDCMASLGGVGEQTDGLRTGGNSSFQVCFDIPEAAASGAQIRVGDQLDFGSDPVVWEIP